RLRLHHRPAGDRGPEPLGKHRRVSRPLALDTHASEPRAAPAAAGGERPALPCGQQRDGLQHPAHPGPRGRDDPLPGRVARDADHRPARPPGGPARANRRVVPEAPGGVITWASLALHLEPNRLPGAAFTHRHTGFLEEALMPRSLRRVLTFATGSLVVMAPGPALTAVRAANQQTAFGDINHVVVIYEENHSFDNLYGGWEGVNAGPAPPTSPRFAQAGRPVACRAN